RVMAQQKSLSNAAGAPDPDAVTLEDGLARQALAHKARVDQARQTLQAARSAYADAEANATRAAGEAGMMQEALESVTATARQASAVADDASADDAAARKLVADKTAARDVAQREA